MYCTLHPLAPVPYFPSCVAPLYFSDLDLTLPSKVFVACKFVHAVCLLGILY